MRNQYKPLLILGVILAISLLLQAFSSSAEGSENRYEVRPEITLPEYRTDIARILDAYERLMDRYMSINEEKLSNLQTEIGQISAKVEQMSREISDVSEQLETIQKKLGIEVQKKTAKTPPMVAEDAGAPRK